MRVSTMMNSAVSDLTDMLWERTPLMSPRNNAAVHVCEVLTNDLVKVYIPTSIGNVPFTVGY